MRLSSIILICVISALSIEPSLDASNLKNPIIIPTAADLSALTAADVNNDGKVDLIYTEKGQQTSTLHVLLGNGSGGFHQSSIISMPIGFCSYACHLAISRITSDANPDLIVTPSNSGEGSIVVYPGNGDGTFQDMIQSESVNVASFPSLTGPAIADVNGDSHLDVVVADAQNNKYFVFLGDGTGHLQLAFQHGGGGRQVQLYDLNGDGFLDLIFIGANGGASVALGNGNATFQDQTYYNYPGSTVIADIDHDNHPDIVVGQYPGQVIYFKGRSDGGFNDSIKICDTSTTPSLFSIFSFADYTGDGIPDLAWLTVSGVTVLPLGQNLSCGSSVNSVAVAALERATAVADFNNDGKSDMAMAILGGIAVLLGKGDGTFASTDAYDLGHVVIDSVIADFNGDGKPDIAVGLTESAPRLLLNLGGGVFQLGANPTLPDTSFSSRWASGDFDCDGKADLITAAYPNTPQLLFGNGDGTFQSPVDLAGGSTLIADVNKDGCSDTIGVGLNSSSITVLLGQHNRGFTNLSIPLRNPGFATALVLGDLNGDGNPDLLIGGFGILEVWLGTGNGTFVYNNVTTLPGQQFGALSPDSIAIGDLDGDSKADVAFAISNQPGFAVLYGNGNGTLQPPVTRSLTRNYISLQIADMDQDGKPDLVFYRDEGIAAIRNLGARIFDEETPYLAGSGLNKINIRDLNGDGYPDIVAADSQSTFETVLLSGNYPSAPTASGSLTDSPDPSDFGQPFTITFTAAPHEAGDPVPTGLISLAIDGKLYSTATLNLGMASFLIGGGFPGPHALAVTYYGDDFYRTSSFIGQHTINTQLIPTQTTLAANPTSIYTSQTVRLVSTVTSPGTLLNGYVTFYDGENVVRSQVVNVLRATYENKSGKVVVDTATLSPGLHTFKATYQGFAIYNDINRETYLPSTSPSVQVLVNARPTQTVLTSSQASVVEGTVVTFTAAVSSSIPPFGAVTFFDGVTPLGTTQLRANETAIFSTAGLIGRGPHSISAHFSSNSTFAASDSAGINVSLERAVSNLAETVVALTESPGSGDLALHATVRSVKDGSVADNSQGIVIFLSDGKIVGTSALDEQGNASVVIQDSYGEQTLQASFTGDRKLAPSVSPQLRSARLPNEPSFWIHTQHQSQEFISVDSEPVSVTVSGMNDFHGRVHLTCDGLPKHYVCDFLPPVLVNEGNSALLIRQVNAGLPGGKLNAGIMVGAFFAFMIFVSRRRPAVIFLLVCLGLIVGCGGQIRLPMSPTSQTLILTINGTSIHQSTSQIHSAQIAVRIP